MKNLLKYVLAASAAVLLLGGVAYINAVPRAQAQSVQPTPPAGAPSDQTAPQMGGPGFGRHGHGGGSGEVTAVGADSLTVTMVGGRVMTATLTSDTQVTILATGREGSLSDIKVGDQVRVKGRFDGAEAVEILPAGDVAQGKVTAVEGTKLTLAAWDATQAVVTDSRTTFRLPDGTAGTLADVTTDKFVEAYGQTQADGSLTATLVLVKDAPAGRGAPAGAPQDGRPGRGGRGGGSGEVTAVSADSLTVTMADGQVMTATLTSNTQVTILATGAEGSVSDIKVGGNVRMMGRPDQSGTLTAEAVVILPAGDMARGKVTVVEGGTLTLADRDSTVTVKTDSRTAFRLADGTVGTLADVTTDKFVEAYGQTQADGSLAATLVLVKDQSAGPHGPGDGRRGGGHAGAGPCSDGSTLPEPGAPVAP